MAEFSKARFILFLYLSPPRDRRWLLSVFVLLHKRGCQLEGRKRCCLLGQEPQDAWMELPPGCASSHPCGGNLWLRPQQQVANCLQCSLGCRNRSKKPCEGENWIDPMSLRTMLRWMMNGYFGNLTNTMIYIHDGLIPEGLLEWAYSRVLWSFRVWTEWKMIWKAIPCEVQGQEDQFFIICFLTKPQIWKVERRAK